MHQLHIVIYHFLTWMLRPGKTLNESYETHVVQNLCEVINVQDQTYRVVETRHIKVEQWHQFLIYKQFLANEIK